MQIKPPPSQRLAAAVAAALLVSSPTALAFEWNGRVGFGVWQSDNETRSSTTELDETTYEPVVGLSLQENTRTLQLDANYQAQRRIFRKDVFSDQTVVTGSGSLYWEALPNRFDLSVLQNSTEATLQSFARADQGTRQETRTTEATPRLRFRIRGTDELQFSYRYRDFSQELFDVDSETNDLIGRYQLGLSERSQLSFEYIDGKTEYEAAGAPELERQVLQASYSTTRERSRFQLTGGRSEFERSGRDDADGFTGSLLWTVDLNQESSLSLSASRDITDRSDQFLNRGLGLDPAVPGVQVGNTDLIELSTLTTARVDYGVAIGANRINLSVGHFDNDFEDLPRDEERTDIGVTWNRDLRRSLRGSVNVRHMEGDFEQLSAAEFQQLFATAAVFWEPIRNFELIFRAQYTERDGEALSGDFEETRFYVGFLYEFGSGEGTPRTVRNR